MKLILLALTLTLALALSAPALAADLDPCAQHTPYGTPELTIEATTTPVCHRGYASLHDDDHLIPRWVAYRLTGPHTLGCEVRSNKFHAELQLPENHRATPGDYLRSGYDRGHQMPAGDAAWSKAMSLDTFSMANMAPQLPGLNRQQWERLEETVRTWAYERGEVAVYVGPVLPALVKWIGPNEVGIPTAFFKVVIDMNSKEAIAFVMPQDNIPKGDLEPWQVAVADVEGQTSLDLPLPSGADRTAKPPLWPADRAAWNNAKREKCSQ